MTTASPEVLAAVKEFKERLLPAKLKDTALNGQRIALWCNANKGGVASAENMYEATKSIYASLEWDVPPAILVRDQNEQKVNKIKPGIKQEADFAEKVKAGELKAAKEKQDKKNIAAARTAIHAYLPIDRRGRVVHGRQAEVQARLNKYLDQESTRKNVSTADILAKVLAHIAELYKADECALEHI